MNAQQRWADLDMAGRTFRGLHLTNALFEHCDFHGATFVECQFRDLILRGSNLESTRFEKCLMHDVTLLSCHARGMRVESGCVDGLRCHEGEFDEVSLGGVIVQQCTLLHLRADGFRAEGCRIGHATFTEVETKHMHFEKGSLLDAVWFDCTLEKAGFHAMTIDRQVMGRTALEDCTWHDVEGRGATWFNCRARGMVFEASPLRRLSFHQSRVEHSDLGSLSLDEAVLGQTQLIDCDFAHASLERAFADGARLERCNLRGVRAGASSWRGAHFVGCAMGGSDFSLADLRDARLDDTNNLPSRAEGARIHGATADGALLDAGVAPWDTAADDPLSRTRQQWRDQRWHPPCQSNLQKRP
jgi:uncharacterized protein YjbI with pentapeptide repeats